MQRTWLSCLLQLGTAIVRFDDLVVADSVLVVLKVGGSGAYCWKATSTFVDGVTWVSLQSNGTAPLDIVHIPDISTWAVFKLKTIMPGELEERFAGEVSSLGLALATLKFRSESPQSLLKSSALAAFKHLTCAQMKGVAKYSGFRDDRGLLPSIELDLCKLLVYRTLPELSQEQFGDIVAMRGAKKRAPFVSVVKESDKSALAEVLPNGEVDEVEKEVFAKKRQVEAPRSKVAARRPPPAEQPPAAAPAPVVDASGSAASEPVAPDGNVLARPQRPLRAIVGEEWTAAEAREFLPVCQGVSMSIHTARSWQGKYLLRSSAGPKSHTKSWNQGLTHREAMIQVIAWVWSRHTERTGEECPWDLS